MGQSKAENPPSAGNKSELIRIKNEGQGYVTSQV